MRVVYMLILHVMVVVFCHYSTDRSMDHARMLPLSMGPGMANEENR
jgi:hypothetical protein